MSPFRIGNFRFLSLSRALSGPVQHIERQVLPGFDGVAFWRTGRRSEPTPLRSVVDCASVGHALALLHQYEGLVGQDPVTAAWADQELGELVFVHGVVPEERGAHAILLGIGGNEGNAARAMLRCIWLVETIDPFNF